VNGVRAALCNDLYLAEMARSHNNANVLSMGGRVVTFDQAEKILEVFMTTEYEGGRHERRVAQLAEIEQQEGAR
jgi:ribose 5-phosphate isomerase B